MPELMSDVFSPDAFSMVELSDAIIMVPNQWGRIGQLGLFGAGKGVPTLSVEIEIANRVLNILPTGTRGLPGTLGQSGKRAVELFKIPYIPHQDRVAAAEVIGVRAFGKATQLQTVEEAVNEKLFNLRMKHALTLEWHRAGALRGTILDADGSTVLLNLFTRFGVTEKVVAFDLANADADISGKCHEVTAHIEDNLMGDVMTGVRALCSPEFWKAFIKHPKVVDAYKFYEANQNAGKNILRNDLSKGFSHMDIVWEEYRGQATNLLADGTSATRRFIAANDVRFFPEGTTQSFETYWAPADYLETVNTIGRELYVKPIPELDNRGVTLDSQSSPLPICKRPSVLVRGHLGAP